MHSLRSPTWGKAVEDEDLDALLAEFKEDDADDEFDAAVEECKLVAADAAQPEGQEDKAEDETINAKTLANRKKKEKRKAKQQEKTGGEGIQATAAEEEQAESKQPASSSSKDEAPAAAAKKGAKKESAYVKAARERLEHEQKLAEEKRAFEEAERCRVEEEQRQIDEEERKKEEERERKRERKAARTAKQKAEGTYLTKKQREQAKRAAQYREQLGYSVATDGDKEAEETEKPQTIPLATKKKKETSARTGDRGDGGEGDWEAWGRKTGTSWGTGGRKWWRRLGEEAGSWSRRGVSQSRWSWNCSRIRRRQRQQPQQR